MLGHHSRPQHLREPQRNVGVLRDIGRGLLERDAVEPDLGLARSDHVVVVDRGVIEVARRQRFEPVAETAGVEHVGHQHGVLVRAHLDAAHRENLPFEFQVLADLEHARIFEQRLERCERVRLGNLAGRKSFAEQPAVAIAGLAMSERYVAGLVRRDREREPAQRTPASGLRRRSRH